MIYFDHNATTPLDERVVDAMLPYLTGHFGNPSSIHRYGRAARAALDHAREQVAALINAHPSQIIFTSGGTEANNLALKGTMAGVAAGRRLTVSAVEHASVLEPARALAARGCPLDIIPVDSEGRVTAQGLADSVGASTHLVSVMLANNETGVMQDLHAVSAAARAAGAYVHTDAVQAAGKIPVDFTASGAHMMSLSAHKIHGPKGVGALVVDKAIALEPLLHGGGQERGWRGGTENVAGIAGFGAAAELARTEAGARRAHSVRLRARLEERLALELPGITIIARAAERLPNTVMLAVPGIEGAALLLQLDQAGFAVSSGSACAAGSTEASHVLTAMGVPPELAHSVIRVSLGRANSEADVDALAGALVEQWRRIQGMAITAW